MTENIFDLEKVYLVRAYSTGYIDSIHKAKVDAEERAKIASKDYQHTAYKDAVWIVNEMEVSEKPIEKASPQEYDGIITVTGTVKGMQVLTDIKGNGNTNPEQLRCVVLQMMMNLMDFYKDFLGRNRLSQVKGEPLT